MRPNDSNDIVIKYNFFFNYLLMVLRVCLFLDFFFAISTHLSVFKKRLESFCQLSVFVL